MKSKLTFTNIMPWLFPLLLIVPNIWLSCTMRMAVALKIANVLLPLGLYLLAMCITKKTAKTVLAFFPLMVLNSFQIVLFFLYGSGIIAVDMFLNVVTTSMSEVTELLDSLLVSISLVLVLYLPPIVWSIIRLCRKKTDVPNLAPVKGTGLGLVAAGVMLAAFYVSPMLPRQIYPVNICCNLVEAFSRFHLTKNYHATARAFTHNASSLHNPDEKEVYVLVVGETSRADNWQLMGYDRPTTPDLCARHDVLAYPRTLSESNTTHKSVPMILSHLNSYSFGDSIYSSKSIINAFKEAGFYTIFLSNQKPNRSFIDFFGEEADLHRFIVLEGEEQYDGNLLKDFQQTLDSALAHNNKVFVTLHTYGSHFCYRDRYPDYMAHFKPDSYVSAEPENREQLINAYDNTIRYTDAFLAAVIRHLEIADASAAMLYLSDHGEDIFDDSRKRFLHASPTPTYYQLHVPLVLWASEEYALAHPEKLEAAKSHTDCRVSSSRTAFHSILDLAGVASPYFIASESLASPLYEEKPWRYVNDYNESVALEDSGITDLDLELISQLY